MYSKDWTCYSSNVLGDTLAENLSTAKNKLLIIFCLPPILKTDYFNCFFLSLKQQSAGHHICFLFFCCMLSWSRRNASFWLNQYWPRCESLNKEKQTKTKINNYNTRTQSRKYAMSSKYWSTRWKMTSHLSLVDLRRLPFFLLLD